MKNLRNVNQPPNADLVQKYLESSWDIVVAVYSQLANIQTIADQINGPGLDFLSPADIDTLAELNALVLDATIPDSTKIDLITVTQAVNLDTLVTRVNDLDAAVVLKGTWDATSGVFPGGGTAQAGESWIVSVAGTVDGVDFVQDDRIIAILDNASTGTYAANWHKADYSDLVSSVAGLTGAISAAGLRTAINVEDGATADQTGAEIKTLLFAEADTNNLTDTLLGKLNGIETGATADQTGPEVAALYNAEVAIVSQVDAEAGTSTTAYRWTPQRVAQAIAALGGGTGGLAALIKNANYTAVPGDFVFADTSAGIWTLQMPATPQLNDLVVCKDLLGTCGQNKVTLDGNGKNINGNLNAYLDTPFATIWCIYDGTEWKATVDGMMLQGPTEHMSFALSDETSDLATGVAKLTTRSPYQFFVTAVRASVNTAPVGADIQIDINQSGISIFSNGVLTIDAGEKTSTTSAVTNPMGVAVIIFGDDEEITFDIDQVGSTTKGKGLKVIIEGYRVQL